MPTLITDKVPTWLFATGKCHLTRAVMMPGVYVFHLPPTNTMTLVWGAVNVLCDAQTMPMFGLFRLVNSNGFRMCEGGYTSYPSRWGVPENINVRLRKRQRSLSWLHTLRAIWSQREGLRLRSHVRRCGRNSCSNWPVMYRRTWRNSVARAQGSCKGWIVI